MGRLGLSLQAACAFIVWPYYHTAYRIRGWGGLPKQRGPTLIIANHQHDLDPTGPLMHLAVGGPVNETIRATSGRRLFEPGFMGFQVRWLEWLLRPFNTSWLFLALGMRPIENQIRSRSIGAFARVVYDRHGDLPLRLVFSEDTVRGFDPTLVDKNLSDMSKARVFRRALLHEVPMRSVNEPYRGEMIAQLRVSIEEDLVGLESVLKDGHTLFLTPEGKYTRNGRLSRLRTALWRLLPLAERVYLLAISYDVFVGPRLSMLFRVLLPADPDDLATSLKAARPVTVSQLIADWLVECSARAKLGDVAVEFIRPPSERGELGAFSEQDALAAVHARLAKLPPAAWVDPELHAAPTRMTQAAIGGMLRLGLLERTPRGYALTDKRAHPQFPLVKDILAHQAAFFEESAAAWAKLERRSRQEEGLHNRAVAPS